MIPKTMNPGALAGATGAKEIVFADGFDTTACTLTVQASRIARRFGLTPAIAGTVAALAYAEVAR